MKSVIQPHNDLTSATNSSKIINLKTDSWCKLLCCICGTAFLPRVLVNKSDSPVIVFMYNSFFDHNFYHFLQHQKYIFLIIEIRAYVKLFQWISIKNIPIIIMCLFYHQYFVNRKLKFHIDAYYLPIVFVNFATIHS